MANTHPKFDFYIPAGRMVQGSTTDIQKIDPKTKKEQPEEKWRKFLAIAVSKQTPGINELNQLFMNTAWNAYQHVPAIANEIRKGFADKEAKFAWKIEDGDHPDNVNKEGHAGCWIYKCQTAILDLPKTCDAQNAQIDPALIKCGYYIDIKGNTQANGYTEPGTAGLYVNPVWVRLLGIGPEITTGQSAEQAFAGMPAAQMGTPLPAGVAPGMPAPGGAAPALSAPPTAGAPAVPAAPSVSTPAHAPSVPGVPANASLSNPPAVTPQPGFANGTVGAAPVPPAPPAPPAAPVAETAAQVAARYGFQHYPGHRYDPAKNAYVPDPTSV